MSDRGPQRQDSPASGESPPARRRFVVLLHDHPLLHWDLMLEDGDALRTWRLPRDPGRHDVMEAEEIAPHRLAYLDYEGPVSQGRGTVRRVAAGTTTILRTEGGGLVFDAVLPTAGSAGDQALPWKSILLTPTDGARWHFQASGSDLPPPPGVASER